MATRLRLRLETGEMVEAFTALLNSGYEADTPQLMLPVEAAKRLNLWPPEGAEEATFGTAGGPTRVWIFRRMGKVKVLDDAASKLVEIDIVVSPLADEVLISDMLAGELEVAVEDFAKGLWRFRWEPKEKVRRSEPAQFW